MAMFNQLLEKGAKNIRETLTNPQPALENVVDQYFPPTQPVSNRLKLRLAGGKDFMDWAMRIQGMAAGVINPIGWQPGTSNFNAVQELANSGTKIGPFQELGPSPNSDIWRRLDELRKMLSQQKK